MRIADKIKNARIGIYAGAGSRKSYGFPTDYFKLGKSLPDIISIIRMSDLYGLSLDELLKGDKILMKKIEKDVTAIQTEKKIIKFAWVSIVLGAIMIVLGTIFQGNPVIDFINGALPWVLLGLMFLFAMLYLNKEEENRKS